MKDTETINQAAFRAIGEEYGKKFTVEMKNNIAGCVQKETARRLVEYMDLPITPEECLETFLSFTRDKLPDCDYMPGPINAESAVCLQLVCISGS
ncbi:unnamed protein product [Acanthoscelides obtectus]|uniref:Uncharacterized protein n=1 Tax=Acanthoscelides obtectus TaxID=200917 RepID=A0A9P0P1I7_ACAOB|nr:unnamed protein product [Acanthoscelides obtectus]CAK1625229.1 hypothetical protein AOBTE_LOCUS3048 [Acanthoscelides obtectus]